MSKFLLGYDIGSSSVKGALVEADTGKITAAGQYPDRELEIHSPEHGWAEQNPEVWWNCLQKVTQKLLANSGISPDNIASIGISYQMHGLVIVDDNYEVLRPSIIWCDSRAVELGKQAFSTLGEDYCLEHFLNSPGNFTASKLGWVEQNEPEIFEKVHKFMLPGDYMAFRLSGDINTTISGLSEGIFWDYPSHDISEKILDHYGIERSMVPDVVPTFAVQGKVSPSAAELLGLKAGTPIGYRAGDQPNNAFSLNVLAPGEAAVTGGTSGVIYGITDQLAYDEKSRVNTFVHVNHNKSAPRYGVLLCINGTGILNSWVKKRFGSDLSYDQMNTAASSVGEGSDNLFILPFGNGAERILENRDPGASFHGLNFNRHDEKHIFRSVQEGIAFSMNYGIRIMRDMNITCQTMRAGKANLFLSPLFREIFVNTLGVELELYNTDGAVGAARGGGAGAGIYDNFAQAVNGMECLEKLSPKKEAMKIYSELYQRWEALLQNSIS